MLGYDRLVIYRGLDADKLRKVLAEQCTSEQGLEILNGNLPLMQQLTKFFQSGLNSKEQRFALVLDDFEANLELRGDGVWVLQPQVVDVLLALLKAVQNCRLPHKVIITSRYDFVLSELNQRLHRENLAALRDADLTKKYSRLNAFNGVLGIDAELQEHAKTVADGNPRLLEWLNQILQDSTLQVQGVEAILQKMQGEEERFRENILAEELLKLQKPGLRKMLGKLLVYELPVPKAAISAICGDISGWEGYLKPSVSLGLLEEVTVNGGEVLYRVPRILEPLLKFAGEELYPQAARVLYRLWWEEAETSTEAQRLEIHRLALLGKEKEIAAKINQALAPAWNKKSRYREVVNICRSTLDVAEDYRIFHSLASAEDELGDIEDCLQHYQKALDLCPSEEEKEKASIIHNLATVHAQQGEVQQAIALYNQSLDIEKRIGNVQGEAATLHSLAGIYAQQGEVQQAIALYNQSLDIKKRIGDVQGEAATLHQLAGIYAQQGEVEQAINLFQQSLAIKERIGNVHGKAMTLWWLGHLAEQQGEYAQAISYLQPALEILQKLKSPNAEQVRAMLERIQNNS
ncbi:tetratricopeptide repeat protein [Nostoc sp. CCY0012]|uniref:tetratricopeptide repeat protein n=1 Tax=Nostoc sp. CCY0012 TaxID=1056123 RepID=UPI0039C6CD8F